MPKVSVIVPNYNHAPYLEKRLQSILDQTYQDFEIIFLDDASKDNSLEIFSKFSDNPRIRAILNETNSGTPFKQWNKGIKYATGEYIWIAESDDYAAPTLLEKLVKILDESSSVGIAYCQSDIVSEKGNILSAHHFPSENFDYKRWYHDFTNNGRDECKNYLAYDCTIPNASAVVFRRSLYQKIGGADESMSLCGDWLVWSKMLLHSDVAFIAETLNFFRKHTGTCRARFAKAYIHEYVEVLKVLNNNLKLSNQEMLNVSRTIIQRWEKVLYRHSPSIINQLLFYKKLLFLSNSLYIQLFIIYKLTIILVPYIRFKLGLKSKLKYCINYCSLDRYKWRN